MEIVYEPVDIQQYHKEHIKTLSEEEQQAIRQTHVERAKQGDEVWNAWAKQVLTAIEETYPETADKEEKLAIRNQYVVDFSGFEFDGGMNSSFFEFEESIVFSFFEFPIAVSFWFATFPGDAYFLGAKFSGDADFKGTTFSGDADFEGATFSDEAYFERATFTQDANFKGCRFIGNDQNITFLGAQFQQQSFFIDMHFADAAQAIPCDFRQTDFHLPPLVTDFPSDLSIFKKANKDKQRDKAFYKDCEDRFRELKKLAEGNNNHQKSLEFYGCELYCQRRASGNLKNGVSGMYGFFSKYGLSLSRPALLWLAVMLGGMGLQAVLDDKLSFSPTATVNTERVGFYLSPSLPPFTNKPLYQKEVRERLYVANPQNEQLSGQLPAWNRVIRFFQALFSFILMFLFGLALRNRFKIK